MTEQADSSITIDGVLFDIIGGAMQKATPTHFGLRKAPWMVDRYREFAARFPQANIVELGVDRGASTAFLHLVMAPKHLLALDIKPNNQPALQTFLDSHDPDGRVQVVWETDQADVGRLADLLDQAFGTESLDLVIDDASHQLAPSRASFDLLFPRLRPGGMYVIEDWSWQHKFEHKLSELVGDPDSEQGKTRIAQLLENQPDTPQPLMSQLMMELSVICGYRSDIIPEIRMRSGWAEVVRGGAALDSTYAVRDLMGALARNLLP
jgi:predicted O-methyltransferase YrrM